MGNTEERKSRNLGPSIHVAIPFTSRGLRISAETGFGAANFYLYFLENDARGEQSKMPEIALGLRKWRAEYEHLKARFDAATERVAGELEAIGVKQLLNSESHTVECNSRYSFMLANLYRSADATLAKIRLAEIVGLVDKEEADIKKREIRSDVDRHIRSISHLFKFAIKNMSNKEERPLANVARERELNQEETVG